MASHIRESIVDFLQFAQQIGPSQVQGLCQFVNPRTCVPIDTNAMLALVRDVSPEVLDCLLQRAANQHPGGEVNVCAPTLNNTFKQQQHQDTIMLDESTETQFTQLYHLVVLRSILRETSHEQLLLVFRMLDPSKQQVQRLDLLDHIQKLLDQLEPATLVSLHEEFAKAPEPELLHKLVQLPTEWFHLYEPLRQLLQLPIEEIREFQQCFPAFDLVQKMLLLCLVDAGILHAFDIIRLLVPEKAHQLAALKFEEDDEDLSMPSFEVEILEQPPDKCVYRRNVKPAPTVLISGDQSANDGNLYLAPVLVRCDTNEDLSEFLSGSEPTKITASSIISFPKLKIQQTSHRMSETLFCLRFEVRQYEGDAYTVIHSVLSNPLCVVSHSTQLKAPPKSQPHVAEVIPFYGPPTGKTRVAVLGNNFVDSPTTRVMFDEIEVMPIFHGSRTLICHTPAHPPGTVLVRVCNDSHRWSETCGEYTYEAPIKREQVSGAHQAFNVSNLRPADKQSLIDVTENDVFDIPGGPAMANPQSEMFIDFQSTIFDAGNGVKGYSNSLRNSGLSSTVTSQMSNIQN